MVHWRTHRLRPLVHDRCENTHQRCGPTWRRRRSRASSLRRVLTGTVILLDDTPERKPGPKVSLVLRRDSRLLPARESSSLKKDLDSLGQDGESLWTRHGIGNAEP